MNLKSRQTTEPTFRKIFYLASLLYFILFYVIPLVLLSLSGGDVMYAERQFYFTDQEILHAALSGGLFWGAFLFALYFFFPRMGQECIKAARPQQGLLKLASAIYLVFYIAYFYFFTGVDYAYSVRRGDVQGSHLLFFFNILLGVLGVFLVLKLDDLIQKRFALILLLSLFAVGLFTASGRYGLLVLLIMIAALLFRFKLNIVYIICGLLFLVSSLPVIINMKHVIYHVGLGGNFFEIDFASFYQFENLIPGYILNFGHPVLSLLVVDSTIDQIGFRFFYDYIQGFLFFLRVIGLDFGNSLTYFNTYSFIGVHESIIPTGYIAFGFIQCHFIGIIISGFFYCFVGYICNLIRVRIAPQSTAAKYFFAITAANTFYHGEMRLIVMTVFLGLALMLVYDKFLKVKW